MKRALAVIALLCVGLFASSARVDASTRSAPTAAVAAVKARFSLSTHQAVAKNGYVKVVASCDQACRISAQATFALEGTEDLLHTSPLRKSLKAGKRTTLKIKLSDPTREALQQALKDRTNTTATVIVKLAGGISLKPVGLTVTG